MSMFRRVLAGASLVASLAVTTVGVAPATAADSGVCDPYRSRRLLTANQGEYKLWVDQFTDVYGRETTNVCWKSTTVSGGVLTFRSPFRGSPVPTVDYTVNDANCPNLFTVEDPVQAVIELYAGIFSNPADVCFGVSDNRAIRVRVGTPYVGIPSVELWLDKNTTAGREYCYALTVAGIYESTCRSSTYTGVRVI